MVPAETRRPRVAPRPPPSSSMSPRSERLGAAPLCACAALGRAKSVPLAGLDPLAPGHHRHADAIIVDLQVAVRRAAHRLGHHALDLLMMTDRKSTRLNSSHIPLS